jgi:hypothetical protein
MSEPDISVQREEIDRLFRNLANKRYAPPEERAKLLFDLAKRAKVMSAMLEKSASTLLAELKAKT